MKVRIAIAFLLLAAWMAGCASSTTPSRTAVAGDVPYRLTLRRIPIAGLPGLHSVAHAVYVLGGGFNLPDTQFLVLAAGRRNGLHSFTKQREPGLSESFPPNKANDTIYVVDLTAGSLYGSLKVEDQTDPDDFKHGLPPRIARQLRATNTQSFTRGDWFYIVGGYGAAEDGSMQTFGQVLAIQLFGLLTEASPLKSGGPGRLDAQFAAENMSVGSHPALAVTGGAIANLGDKTLLVFGQKFNGLYTTDSAVAQQEYSQAVRVLTLSEPRKIPFSRKLPDIEVKYLCKTPDPDAVDPQPTPEQFTHRRDFSQTRVLDPVSGKSRIGVFGGVFKGGRMEGFLTPVYITPGPTTICKDRTTDHPITLPFTVNEDLGSSQLLSQYESVIIPVYSDSLKAMYTTSLGGISQYHWDGKALKRDAMNVSANPPVDGLPFINSISTLRVGGPGNGDFLHEGEQFPKVGDEPRCDGRPASYLGANSLFVMALDVPLRSGVILLDEIKEKKVIGYVFGGIASMAPYPGPDTCASDALYEVTLDPGTATNTRMLQAPP